MQYHVIVPVPSRSPRDTSRMEPRTDPRSVRGWWIPDAVFLGLRVVAALLVVQLSARTLFGVLLPAGQRFAGQPAPLTDTWIVSTLAIAASAFLILGLFTRVASLALAALTAFAYAGGALSGGQYWPVTNLGAGAILAFFLFLTFATIGPGQFSLDAMLANRRRPNQPATTVELSPWIKRQYRRHSLSR